MSHLVKITQKNFLIYQAQILEIERRSFPTPWSVNAFVAEIRKPISNLWALTIDKILWGYMCFWMFDREIQLVNIAVHPLKRGQHHGQSLLEKMLEIGIQHGIHYIWLEVRPSNQAAKNLYYKFGFREIGRRPRYYPDTNEDAIVMALGTPKKGTDRLNEK